MLTYITTWTRGDSPGDFEDGIAYAENKVEKAINFKPLDEDTRYYIEVWEEDEEGNDKHIQTLVQDFGDSDWNICFDLGEKFADEVVGKQERSDYRNIGIYVEGNDLGESSSFG